MAPDIAAAKALVQSGKLKSLGGDLTIRGGDRRGLTSPPS